MPVELDHVTHVGKDHVVLFYDRETELVDAAGRYLADAVAAGDVAVVVATSEHRLAFERHMVAAGVDVARARADHLLVEVDAAGTMAQFMVDDAAEPTRFHAVIGELIRGAAATGRPVRAYGEMVALLWDAGNVAAAIDLETLWNDLRREITFSLFCAYPAASVDGDDQVEALHDVCRLHSAVVEVSAAAAREADRAFGAETDAPGHARRFVVDTFEAWGYGSVADEAAVVVTELATNAVVHAESPFTVSVSSGEGAVRISVRDTSPIPPLARDAGLPELSGRGLRLVAALSSRWGTEAHADGKVVWAELSA